jgi:serine/threonine protein kinase
MTIPSIRTSAALRGRYRLGPELGSGGMATVYRAQDLRHRREVAIKVLHPAVASSIGPERFLREIEIAAGLSHPHILPLLDSGDAEGVLYYVMPIVEGPSLRDRLRRSGELPVDEAVGILRDLADALSYAHGRGIVHRDVKPENVLLAGSHAQLTDFGVAKAVHDAAQSGSLTGTGVIVGTPAYMAPEQAAGDPQIDHRADLYAVGVLGYEMLTGAPPFSGLAPQQMLAAQLTREIEPLGIVRPSVPPSVAAAIMRCLERRPADRWQSADELRRRLRMEDGASSSGARAAPPIARGSLPITEDLCRRLDRSAFDPRMIGDAMHYVDNQVTSDVLVLFVDRWGFDVSDSLEQLPAMPFRTVVPTLFGFDAGRPVRFPLGIHDHLTLLEALLRDLTARIVPRFVLVVGFSAGGDLMLRLAAEADAATRIDGCLALGSNLGLETCFVTRVLAEVSSSEAGVILPAVNRALSAAGTVYDWVNLAGYLVEIVRNFHSDWRPIQAFAAGIVEPWMTEGHDPFVQWYRAATERGRQVRAVFEDSALYRGRVRELQLQNLDRGLLGQAYRPGSIVVEPVASHFDLVKPDRLVRQIQSLIADLRADSAGRWTTPA